MKRVGNLYDLVSSEDSLTKAFHDASRGKKKKIPCIKFENNLEENVKRLSEELRSGAYKPRPYYNFLVYEPKKRQISAPAFRDRVVQHSVYSAVREIFDRRFIHTNFGCRVGKGTHKASDYVHKCLQQSDGDSYVLQMDIRKYYYSLDRNILRGLIEKVIKDKRLVDLIMMFAETEDQKGVPIGNLMSQLFGLIFLNELDQFVKRELKVKFYARYVDDFVLIGLTREEANEYALIIEKFLSEKLGLKLSRVSIFKVRRGINFVGFRTWSSKRFVRKRALYTFRRSLKKGKIESVISSLGHARKTASYKYMLDYIKENNNALHRQLPKKIRSVHHLYSKRP